MAKRGEKTSLETRKKQSKSRLRLKEKLGFLNSPETCRKMSEVRRGKPSGRKGIKHTEETKRKMRKPHKLFSEKTKQKMSESRMGEKHWNWKGGISRAYKTGYWSVEHKKWRMKVFERDNWTCQFCGIRGIYVEAHHIKTWNKYPDLRYDVNNGVTLCKECHKLAHKNRKT